ncbi:MAG: HAD family hydrolase [Pseudomonadota bacterium]
MTKVDGLIFDKDGTLFDYHATWSTASAELIEELAQGDNTIRTRLAEVMDFDLSRGQFRPTSPIIACTNREAAETMSLALPGWDVDALEIELEDFAAAAPLAPAVPLIPLLLNLAAMDLQLGVMTNDSERGARANLRHAGVHDMFDMIVGFDSGYGAKPFPDPLLSIAAKLELEPARCAMVGDSTHDLIAGRAAGMTTVAVLTGVADTEELRPHADVVLRDIGEIPAWLLA